MGYELERAEMEAARNEAEDAYFEARPQIDCNDRRKVFDAGFERGWEKVRPMWPHGLTDTKIDEIAEKMPGGLDGFLKQWGWRQFARAIEDAHGVGPNVELRGAEPIGESSLSNEGFGVSAGQEKGD